MTAKRKVGKEVATVNRLILAGFGGLLGAMARYLISGWAQKQFGSLFPWGTAFMNIGGSFFIGFVMTLAIELAALSTEARIFLVTGVLGGLTTFSSFAYESVRLFQDGSTWLGLGNVMLNLVVGCLSVVLGILTARII